MNIFATDPDPFMAAANLADRHVVKMPLESAQMACTILRTHGLQADWLYKPTHVKHPCTVWASESRHNFNWLVAHGIALCIEYEARYNKQHACFPILTACMTHADLVPNAPGTPFAQAMPDEHKRTDAHEAYQSYLAAKYKTWGDKARWTNAVRPEWA